MEKYKTKIALLGVVVTIVSIVVALIQMYLSKQNGKQDVAVFSSINTTVISSTPSSQVNAQISEQQSNPTTVRYEAAHLTISGTGARVTVEEGEPSMPYDGGVIAATNADTVVYLPKEQALSVTLSGTGARLRISDSIKKQVSVNNSGTGASVSVF